MSPFRWPLDSNATITAMCRRRTPGPESRHNQLQSAGANDDFDVQSTDWLQTHEDPAITWSTTHLASHFDFPMPIWPCNVCFMHDPLFYNRCK